MRLFIHFLGIILIRNFCSSGNFSAIDRTNDDGIYMFPDFLQTRLFVTSFTFTLAYESDQTTELQRSLFLLDSPQVGLMNSRIEYVRPRSGRCLGRDAAERLSVLRQKMRSGVTCN